MVLASQIYAVSLLRKCRGLDETYMAVASKPQQLNVIRLSGVMISL